jgi:nucleoside-triphosphatase
MDKVGPKILLTGPPGCGKTSLIKKVVGRLAMPSRGFYTEEVRGEDNRRIGFDVVMLDGRRGVLSRKRSEGPRVGNYGVDLEFLENVALQHIEPDPGVLLVIDEIGKMECLSPLFIRSVKTALDSGSPVLGTVAAGGTNFILEVRCREGVDLIEVTVAERVRLVEKIVKKVENAKESQK